MAKFKEYDVQEIDALCNLGKALSSPIRIEILQLLYEKGMIIGDIAKELDLPASSTAFHLNILEYKFPNGIPQKRIAKKLSLSMEICSEAAGYNEDWKSDITIWINGKDIGTWTCPSDFGSRRGRLNPPSWPNGSTQYGLPMIWEVRKEGTYLNGEYLGDITIEQLEIMKQSYITVRVGNKSGAQYEGGFNIFGKHYGDYNQDIVLTVEY